MIPMRLVLGWGMVTAMALGISGANGVGHELRDPANLAAERVQPSVTETRIPANEGAAALQQSLVKLRTRASQMFRRAWRDTLGRSMYGMQKLVGGLISERYVRPGHQPKLPPDG